MLVKKPGMTAVVVFTLALGIGANTAIFSVVNAFLYRPMPVPEGERLTVLAMKEAGDDLLSSLSYPDYIDYRDQSDAFSGLSLYGLHLLGITTPDGAERVVVSFVEPNLFQMLRLEPALGRLIQPSDGSGEQAEPVVALSHNFWMRRFGGDPSIVNQSITINARPMTIIGVTPERFMGLYSIAETSAYLPLGMATELGGLDSFETLRGHRAFRGLGRLADGVTIEQAQASLDVISARLSEQYPDTNKNMSVRVIPETNARPEPDASNGLPFISNVFMGLVGLVLLVACVNVANVVLVRATTRRKELAVRAALGAGRNRIIRQMLTESVLLGVLGGAAGLMIGMWASSALSAIRLPGDLPFRFDFSFDWRVFGYAIAAALFTGIFVGVLPALRASRTDLMGALREGGRMPTGSGGRHLLRNSLVVAQVAFSIVLLVAAGLFIRSLEKARAMDLGFNPAGLLNFSMDPKMLGYSEERAEVFYRELIQRTRALPGVESASLAWNYPASYYSTSREVFVEDSLPPVGEPPPSATFNAVDEYYFETMQIPIVSGRGFSREEAAEGREVAIINQSMATRHWPGQNPLGKRFATEGREGPYLTVVGVARDGRYHQSILSEPGEYFFTTPAVLGNLNRVLQVRARGSMAGLALAVRQEIRTLDPALPVYDILTQKEALEGGNGFFLYSIGATLATWMGAVGLLLAAVGIYGVVSHSAGQRTHEIGIRMALGARAGGIFRLVVGQGMRLTLAGIAAGLVLAGLVSQILKGMLFEVNSLDPITFVTVLAILALTSLAAAFLPARRATKVDPMVALRYE